MVRSRRLELPLRLKNSDLNAARLPIPPRPLIYTVVLAAFNLRSQALSLIFKIRELTLIMLSAHMLTLAACHKMPGP